MVRWITYHLPSWYDVFVCLIGMMCHEFSAFMSLCITSRLPSWYVAARIVSPLGTFKYKSFACVIHMDWYVITCNMAAVVVWLHVRWFIDALAYVLMLQYNWLQLDARNKMQCTAFIRRERCWMIQFLVWPSGTYIRFTLCHRVNTFKCDWPAWEF